MKRVSITEEDYMALRAVLAEQPLLSTLGEAVGHVLKAYRRRPAPRRPREG